MIVPLISIILLYIFNPKSVSALGILIGVTYVGFSLPYFVFAFQTLCSGDEIAEYITAVLKVTESKTACKYTPNPNLVELLVNHLKLISVENKRLFALDPNVVVVGLVTANNVLNFWVVMLGTCAGRYLFEPRSIAFLY